LLDGGAATFVPGLEIIDDGVMGGPTVFSEAPVSFFAFTLASIKSAMTSLRSFSFSSSLKIFLSSTAPFLRRSLRLFIHIFERSFGLGQHCVDPLVNLAGLDFQFSSKGADRNLIFEMPTENLGFLRGCKHSSRAGY